MTEEQRQFELGILRILRTQLAAIEVIFTDREKLASPPPSVTLSYGTLSMTTSNAELIADAATALENSFNSQIDALLTAALAARQAGTI